MFKVQVMVIDRPLKMFNALFRQEVKELLAGI